MVLKKLSIEIFIKRKPEQEKPVLTECLSFKTLVTYKKKLTLHWTTMSVVKHLLSDIT